MIEKMEISYMLCIMAKIELYKDNYNDIIFDIVFTIHFTSIVKSSNISQIQLSISFFINLSTQGTSLFQEHSLQT